MVAVLHLDPFEQLVNEHTPPHPEALDVDLGEVGSDRFEFLGDLMGSSLDLLGLGYLSSQRFDLARGPGLLFGEEFGVDLIRVVKPQ